MSQDRTSNVAFITGAGRGIGRATAVALSRRGFACGLLSRSIEQLRETAALCEGRTLCLAADVRDSAALVAAIAQTAAELGPISALVNNAGQAVRLPFAEMTEAIFRETIDTNLTATFVATRAVWDDMVAQRRGVIVNVSSEAARDPFPRFSAYAAAKAGVNLFTKVLAKEAAEHGIRVHAVAPAGVDTAMLRSVVSAADLQGAALLAPEDVAHVITQCVVGDLSSTSGETIYVHQKA